MRADSLSRLPRGSTGAQEDARVPVIVVGYRNPDDVVACLEALDRTSPGPKLSVFVCENAGSRAAADLLRALLDGPCVPAEGQPPVPNWFHSVTALSLRDSEAPVFVGEARENGGYAGGVNAWLRVLMGQANWSGLWLLNPDTVPASDALAALIAHANARGLGMVGSRLVSAPDASRIQLRGLRWRRWMAKPLAVDCNAQAAERPDDAAVEAALDAPSGASLYVTRACVACLGPMREDFFLYYEDLDWGLRAARAGFGIGYAHESVVVHRGGTTTGSGFAGQPASPLALYLEFRNRVAFVQAHYAGWEMWSVLMGLLHALRLLPGGGTGPALRGLSAGVCRKMGRPDDLLVAHRPSVGRDRECS